MVISIGQGLTTADRHEVRVADLGKDQLALLPHTRNVSPGRGRAQAHRSVGEDDASGWPQPVLVVLLGASEDAAEGVSQRRSTPWEHPALPVTPDELARDAARVRAAGAGAVHVHVKDDHGTDTLDGAVLAAVRCAVPGMPICVTTGAWTEGDPARRVNAMGAWTSQPDFASVNWHEPGAEQVASALLDRGVKAEAGPGTPT